MSSANEPHALYRHYDKDGRLLYVGITNDPGRRWKGHKGKEWWHDVETTRIERFPDRRAVEAAERCAIESERPWWNITYNTDTLAMRARCLNVAKLHAFFRRSKNCSDVELDGLRPEVSNFFKRIYVSSIDEVMGGTVDWRRLASRAIASENDQSIRAWGLAAIECVSDLETRCAVDNVSVFDVRYVERFSADEIRLYVSSREQKSKVLDHEPVEVLARKLCAKLAAKSTESPAGDVDRISVREASLLMTADCIPYSVAERVLDWSQRHDYWMKHTKTMFEFRKRFSTLNLAMSSRPRIATRDFGGDVLKMRELIPTLVLNAPGV